MSTPLSLFAHLWDNDAGSVVATASGDQITAWAIGKKKSSAGTVKLGVRFGTAFANAVITAMGGATYAGPLKSYLVELSRDGGATFCTGCWLENVTISLAGPDRGILIDAEDTFSGYTRTYIDHMTFDGAPLEAVLNAPAGSIPVQANPATPTGTTIKGRNYPQTFAGLRGLSQQSTIKASQRSASAAKYAYTFTSAVGTPGAFPQTPINADMWDDSVANALQTVLRAAAGKYDPTDAAPLGARAQYHVDTANKRVLCGYVGTTSKISLVGTLPAGTYEPDQTTTALFDPAKLVINPGNEAMHAQKQFLGGASNHGLPDGAVVTGLQTIFGSAPANAGYCNLLVVACSTGNDTGGIFFDAQDGALRQLSQAFDVADLVLDGTLQVLYAATLHGVFMWQPRASGLTNLPTWTRLGGLNAKILALCIPGQIAGVTQVWALADNGNGTTSIYQYPAIGGEDNTALGFGGWSRIAQGGTITAMAGGLGNLYYVESSDPTTLLWQQPGAPATPIGGATGPFAGAGITGIDYLPTLTAVVVRTTAGSAGLYAIPITTGVPFTLNPFGTGPGGLADAYGYLIVNRVVQSGAPTLNGSIAVLLAATDQGVYFTSQTPGAAPLRWQPATAASGVGDRNVTLVSASPTQPVLGRNFERIYAAGGNSLWVSNSGGVWFFDLLQAALDLGPFWTALAARCGQTPLPNNDVGALVPAGSDLNAVTVNGGAGVVAFIPAGDAFSLPVNTIWARRLTARNDFTYRLLKVDSAAPYNAIDVQELAEITADDSRGAITAAEELALASWRSLAEAGANPLTLALEGLTYRIQEAALPRLITGDLVALTYSDTQIGPDGTSTTVCNWSNAPFYVLAYDEVKQGSVMHVTLQIGTVMALVDDAITLLKEIVSGTSYGLSRDKRYRRIR